MSSPTAADAGLTTGETTRGRPRSADRTEAIIEAAVDVMHDLGWDGFTMQAVATRAGAGLATIYRRWETKEDLVADAMRRDIDDTFLDGGDEPPRERLTALLAHLGDKMCQNDGSMISVLAAAREHDAMALALDETVRSIVRESTRELIDDIIGPDHPQSLTLADAVLGALFFRSGMLRMDSPGDEFAAEMLALVDAVGR